jgi:acyl-coenzyme A synthetase/AMP-(fatty) acid ligase
MPTSIYERGLDRNEAKQVPLTPLHSLDRCTELFPERIAIVHSAMQQTWATTHSRCLRLGSTLVRRDVKRGDTVLIVAPNTPAMVDAHFGVPSSGAVRNINCRLDADGICFVLLHGECKVLFADRETLSRLTRVTPNEQIETARREASRCNTTRWETSLEFRRYHDRGSPHKKPREPSLMSG